MHVCISIEEHTTCFILVPVNAIGYVDASLPKKKAMEEVTDELSTRPGLEVTVHKSGKLRIKKKPDPNWDASRDECLSEASDDEEEEDSDDESAKKKKPVAKKEKKEAKKRPNKGTTTEAEQNGKKKKQKKAKVEVDDKDSEDEEMDRAEQKYLKRQAEEEEADPQDKVEKKAKKDEEEIEDDDDEEGSSGDESESFDDDQVNAYRNSDKLVEGKLYLKGIFNGYMTFNCLLNCTVIESYTCSLYLM